jgi:proteasome accessory factor B
MVVELFRHKRLSFERYRDEHGRDRRSFQRDLQQLRVIGETSGFSISPLKDGSYVELEQYDAKIRTLHREGSKTEQLIADVARAMGQPIAAEIGRLGTVPASAEERFFHFATPTIVEDGESRVSQICAELKAAWESKAVVEFAYPETRSSRASGKRLVEPYRVLLRSGVFYLVGYDRGRRDWRTFALDRFTSIPVRRGSNNVERTIPASYASDDVLGFIKSNEPRTEVTVELNSRVAASATSRRWQADQRIEFLDEQRARITFVVSDLSEVARWAFGFGDDAQVIAPPEAVRIAAQMARSIAAQYRGDASEESG